MKQNAQLLEFPEPDVGAPYPTIFSREHQLILAYYSTFEDEQWDGIYTNVVNAETESALVLVTFEKPIAQKQSLYPDEETYGKYEELGIEPYAFYEILDSAWINELKEIAKPNKNHWPGRLDGARHFICIFHDSSFECIAQSYSWEIQQKSIKNGIIDIVKEL
jgi:hypothetical protein